MKQCFVYFLKNDRAVIGLPMRLVVIVIIGVVAILTILAFILNPCLFPDKMIVKANPSVNKITSGDEKTFVITVHVSDKQGNPIKDANVIIDGLGDAGSDITNNDGKANVSITARLEPGRIQGFLNVRVKSGTCYEEFYQRDMIAVVRA